MSATTIHSTDTTTKARFLAPGTHQRADAKGNGKGQGALPAKGPTKTTKGRVTEPAESVEDEVFAAGDLVLIPLSRLVPSAFNVRKSGGEDVGELAALIKAQGLLQNLVASRWPWTRRLKSRIVGRRSASYASLSRSYPPMQSPARARRQGLRLRYQRWRGV